MNKNNNRFPWTMEREERETKYRTMSLIFAVLAMSILCGLVVWMLFDASAAFPVGVWKILLQGISSVLFFFCAIASWFYWSEYREDKTGIPKWML